MSNKRIDDLYAGTIELAVLLGVTRQTIGKWRRSKLIPQPQKRGIKKIYYVPDVVAAVKRNRLVVDEVAMSVIDQT